MADSAIRSTSLAPLALLALVTAAPGSAHAELFTGKWIGHGAWRDLKFPDKGVCDLMTFEFIQTATEFVVVKGEFTCNPSRRNLGWDTFEFTVEGGTLLWEGLPMGQVSKNKVELLYDGVGVNWQVIFAIDEGELTYQDFTTMGGSGMAVQGVFRRE